MPPGRVLKAWISQASLQKAGTWRCLRLWEVRVVHELASGNLSAVRFGSVDFEMDMEQSV